MDQMQALLLLFLLFSSWLAYVIFEDTEQGKTKFSSYGSTVYHMFILFTTSNNPDVWIPAYKYAISKFDYTLTFLVVHELIYLESIEPCEMDNQLSLFPCSIQYYFSF